MRYLTIIFCSVLVLFYFHQAEAGIIHVPGDASTIQAGIDSATMGDTVLLADGTFAGPGNRDIDFRGKAIIVQSESGNPDACIIDCQGAGRGFYLHSGEGLESVLRKVTITNGSAGRGGGIVCFESSPTISYCTIVGNSAEGGGGIFCSQSSPTISNCTIINNTSVGGGGIACSLSSPHITSCAIMSNTAEWWLFNDGNNTAPEYGRQIPYGSGGGILCMDSSNATIFDCIIANNLAEAMMTGGVGAGICCGNSAPTIANCTIESNRAGGPGFGGGIACSGNPPIIMYCTIANNAGRSGGGIACYQNFPMIANCTITRNIAYQGGGIYCYDCDIAGDITHCILWADSTEEIYVYSGAPPNVTYCDVKGGWPDIGNIDCCPMFCDPYSGNYHLAENSCCVGAGQGGVDIGAFGIGCLAYICGDANGDGVINSADVVYLINYLFKGGPAPDPLWSGDVNCDEIINSADVAYLIDYLFKGGPPPGY